MVDQELKADAHFTALLWAYNQQGCQAVVGDMPMLTWREQAGRRLKVQELQETFKSTIGIWEQHYKAQELSGHEHLGLGYDPSYHAHKEILVAPRASYTTELLRQVAHVSKRVVAVVDEPLMPHIEDQWVKLPRQLRALESFYSMPAPKNQVQQETWLEFIEKQVIMDVLFEPFIFRHFVRLKAFPYDPEGFLGKETAILNLFTFWEHYQNKYVKQLKEAKILEEEFDNYMRQEGLDISEEKAS